LLLDWFKHISFAQPLWFAAMAVIPLLIVWQIVRGGKAQGAMKVSSVQRFRGQGSWKRSIRNLPFIFRLLALAALITALARPQTRDELQFSEGEGIDIVLCIDVSGSMLAQDLTPNRLEAAKNVATEFVDNREADRIGLVVFSGESFTQCPITSDKNVMKQQIANVRSGFLEDGTAIGAGLATSVDRLRSGKTKSKVVILLTDGENNGGLIDPKTAKEIAKSVGVRVYTIGVGTEGMAPVPVQTPGGVVLQNEKVNIDEKLLKEIAGETGGKYFRAKDNAGLKEIYSEIDKLEKSKVEQSTIARYEEKFFPFVWAALALLLLELLLRSTVLKRFP
jgi:Ca-activated chloride channel homolog